MRRTRTAFLLLIVGPAMTLAGGGAYVAVRYSAALGPELDRRAAAHAAAYLRWERARLAAQLQESLDALPERAAELGIERYSIYDPLGRVGTFPVDSLPVPLELPIENGAAMLATARRGTTVVDLALVDGRIRWLAYVPSGDRTAVILLGVDPNLTDRFRSQLGYELALYHFGQRIPPAWDDWPEELPAAISDSLAAKDRTIEARLTGDRIAAAPIKDFDDWDLIGAAVVRRSTQAPAPPGPPTIPLLALVLTAVAASVVVWRAGARVTDSDGPRRLRRGLILALALPALAAAWVVAADARASAWATDHLLRSGARVAQLAETPLPGAVATAPSLTAQSPGELSRLVGTDVAVLRGDSIETASARLPERLFRALEPGAGRLRVGARRLAYFPMDLASGSRLVLFDTPLEDSRKAVLFWLAGLYGLLVVGTLIFASHALAAGSALELREAVTGWTFIGPSLLLLLVFSAAPLLFAFYLSFHGWNLVEPAKPFVGLRHYLELGGDGLFWNAAKNTLIFSLYVPVTMVLSLGVALLLNRRMRGVALLRAVFFMPYITSFVAISIVWQWMYDPEFGLINWALGWVGLGPYPWLGDPATALPALMIMAVWIHIGFQMVIFLAGLQTIPHELYEAAMIDGAGPWRRFWRITVPLLRPTTFFVLVTSIIGSFQVFTFVYVMTEGGPLRATDVIVYHIYQNAWQFLRMGYASAMSWVLFAVIFVITLLQFRLLGRRMTPYG